MRTETFAARLKRLREAAGWTQDLLADRAGLSVAAVRQWEQGRREPSLGMARRLAEALGVSLDRLAGK